MASRRARSPTYFQRVHVIGEAEAGSGGAPAKQTGSSTSLRKRSRRSETLNDNEPELDDLILAALRPFVHGRMDVAEHLLLALETVGGRSTAGAGGELGVRVSEAYGMITKLGVPPPNR